MALYFELTSAQGTPARIALHPGVQRIRVAVGDRYRIYDDATGKTPPDIVVKRLDSHMIIEGLPENATVELTDFYARCGVSSPCTLVVDLPAAPVEISPASPPLQALTDGSFVVYPAGYSGEPESAAADGEGFPAGAGYAIGGLAIVALAGAGGGGGGDSPPPTAIGPSPPAPPPGTDTMAPNQPVVTSNEISASRTPTIAGTAEAGATVRLDLDTDRNGQVDASYLAAADAGGLWRIDLAAQAPVGGALPAGGLPESTPTLATVTASDASQNQSSAVQFDLVVDATAPGAPTITAVLDDVPARVGVVANDGRTNDLSPTIQGQLSAPLAAGERLEVLRNGQMLSPDVSVSGTSWSLADSGLAFGNAYSYTARVVDGVGNASDSGAYRIVVQAASNTAAAVTGVTDNAAPRTGNVADGAATNDNTPTVSGSLSAPLAAGESLQVFRDGAAVTATVIVDGQSWRVTDGGVADGSHTYTARVADVEGAGPTSAGYSIIVDRTNNKTASIGSITDNVGPIVGQVGDGGAVNDPTPTLNGNLSAALAAGEELQILRNDAVISNSAQITGLTWNFTDSGLQNGNYDYTVRIVDAAGNVGPESATFDLRVQLTVASAEAPEAAAVGQPQPEGSLAFDELFAPVPQGAGVTGSGISLPAAWTPSSIASLPNPELLA